MKNNVITIAVAVILAVSLSAGVNYAIISSSGEQKPVWLDLNRLYNGFEMKRELEAKFTTVQQARKKITDSLEFELRVLSKQLQEEGTTAKDKISLFEAKREMFINTKNEFDAENEQTQKTYNEQILTQLNQYVRDLGKEKGYNIILAAEGSGAVMYGKEELEITDEAIVFLNQKYKGVK